MSDKPGGYVGQDFGELSRAAVLERPGNRVALSPVYIGKRLLMKNSGLFTRTILFRGACHHFFASSSLPVILQRLQIADRGMQLAIQNQRNLTAAPFC